MAVKTAEFIGLATDGLAERRLMRLPDEVVQMPVNPGLVTPAKAGVQEVSRHCYWIPLAFAEMTNLHQISASLRSVQQKQSEQLVEEAPPTMCRGDTA